MRDGPSIVLSFGTQVWIEAFQHMSLSFKLLDNDIPIYSFCHRWKTFNPNVETGYTFKHEDSHEALTRYLLVGQVNCTAVIMSSQNTPLTLN